MSKLNVEDFKNLNVSPFAKKVDEVDSLEFLSELEQIEKAGKNRVGVLEAINIRQGILYDLAKPAEGVTDSENPKEEIDVEGAVDGTTTSIEATGNGVPSPPVGDGLLSEGPIGTPGTPGPKGLEYKPEDEVLQKGDEQEEEYAGNKTQEDILIEMDAENRSEQKIKNIRLELDRILQFSEGHFRINEDVNDKIFKAKAWLGKLLHFEGVESPYEVGKIENATKIPATAEKNEGTDFVIARQKFGLKNVLDAVQELRTDLEESAEAVGKMYFDTTKSQICADQAWININEAKFELGKQLSKLRIK